MAAKLTRSKTSKKNKSVVVRKSQGASRAASSPTVGETIYRQLEPAIPGGRGRSRSDDMLSPFFVDILLAIGSLALSAYEISKRSDGESDHSQALAHVRNGLADIQVSLDEISNRLDVVSEQLETMVEDISRNNRADEYEHLLTVATGRANSAIQSLTAYQTSLTTAMQRWDLIDLALLQLQNEVNVILSANAQYARLDEHFQVAHLVSIWRTNWDFKERVGKMLDSDYEIIKSGEHPFFRFYSQSLRSFFNRAIDARPRILHWLDTTKFPKDFGNGQVFENSGNSLHPFRLSRTRFRQSYPLPGPPKGVMRYKSGDPFTGGWQGLALSRRGVLEWKRLPRRNNPEELRDYHGTNELRASFRASQVQDEHAASSRGTLGVINNAATVLRQMDHALAQ